MQAVTFFKNKTTDEKSSFFFTQEALIFKQYLFSAIVIINQRNKFVSFWKLSRYKKYVYATRLKVRKKKLL